MVEFAFTIPILMFIALMMVELTSMFVESQKASAISREAANAIYRDCIGSNDIGGCMDQLLADVTQGAGLLLTDFAGRGRITLNIYQIDGNGNQIPTITRPVGGTATRIVVDQGILAATKFMATAEVFYAHNFMNFFGLGAMDIYESTIY